MTSLAHIVMVSKLRSTACSHAGQITQIFDVVNCPGIAIICVSGLDDDGELVPISQIYEVGGHQFNTADAALLAWDDIERALHDQSC